MIPPIEPFLSNGMLVTTTLHSEKRGGGFSPELEDQRSQDVTPPWTYAVLDNFAPPQKEPIESISAVADEDNRYIPNLIVSLVSKPVPSEAFSEWAGGDSFKVRYLIYLLFELRRRFADAPIEIEYRRDEKVAPLKVYIHGKGDPEEEAELLWELEDELSKRGLYPLDFGVSIIDL